MKIVYINKHTGKNAARTIAATRYGGTFAHVDIALEFASWVSVEFKFYLIKEFQYLKSHQAKELDWNIKRKLTKIKSNKNKIRTLAKLRDTLLPKLMSGEVKVEING